MGSFTACIKFGDGCLCIDFNGICQITLKKQTAWQPLDFSGGGGDIFCFSHLLSIIFLLQLPA
jgi:hypothetical protein